MDIGRYAVRLLFPEPLVDSSVVPEPTYYEINGHFYTIEQIAYAVSVREGSPACGIKQSGQYVYPPREAAYLLCRDKLGKQIDRYGFETALKIWKAVPPYEHYLRDIQTILEKNAYSY